MFNCCQTRRLSTEVYRIIRNFDSSLSEDLQCKDQTLHVLQSRVGCFGVRFSVLCRLEFFCSSQNLVFCSRQCPGSNCIRVEQRQAHGICILPFTTLAATHWWPLGVCAWGFQSRETSTAFETQIKFSQTVYCWELRKAAYLHLICSSSVLDGAPSSPRPVAVCSSSSFVFLHFRLPPPLLYRRLTAMRLRLHVKRKLPTHGLIWTSYPLGRPCHWNCATPWGAYLTSLWPLTLNLLVVDVKLLRDNAWFGGIFSVHTQHTKQSHSPKTLRWKILLRFEVCLTYSLFYH